MTTLHLFWRVAAIRQSDDESELHIRSEIYQSSRWSYGRVYPELIQLMKRGMTSEAALPVTRVSGQVDQFPLTKGLNPSNERCRIHSNEIRWPMTTIEQRLRRSYNYKITLPLNASSHARSPTKSTHKIRVNLVTYSTVRFTYDCIPHANGKDESALTEQRQPSWSSLPAEKKRK